MNPTAMRRYMEINASIEKWSEIFFSVSVKVITPLLTIPLLLLSYFLYFTTDLGAESFRLPFLIWYVPSLIYSVLEVRLIRHRGTIFLLFQGFRLIGRRRLDIWPLTLA